MTTCEVHVLPCIQDGRTPLLLAAEGGHTALVRLLAGRYEADIFHRMKVQII